MKFHITAIGKIRSNSLKNLQNEYIKRTSPYIKINVNTVTPVSKSKNMTRIKVKALEAEKLLQNIPENSYRISLDEKGKLSTTKMFAKYLKKLLVHKRKPVYFIIGGAYGLGKQVKKRSNKVISLSPLTFTHEMSRIILLEQIYRAMTIIKGKKYHY